MNSFIDILQGFCSNYKLSSFYYFLKFKNNHFPRTLLGRNFWKLWKLNGVLKYRFSWKGFLIVGGIPPTILQFFSNPSLPLKSDAPLPPNGAHALLKNEALPSEKQPPPSFKREGPFHGMIPRKSTINNNLKSS